MVSKMATFSAVVVFSLLYLANAGPVSFSGDAPLYNKGLFGGDMVVNPSETYNSIVDSKKLWKDGIVYYYIGESAKVIREYILAGLEEYHQKTCLRFVEVEPGQVPDYIEVGWYSGCWSMVGRMGGKQYMSLGTGCHWKGLVVHEFGHAIGFYHEQQRADRDAYIEILWDNILDGYQEWFNKMKYYEHNLLGENFDYKSIMLYEEEAFSKDGVSPTVKVLQEGKVIGPVWKKDGLSESDVRRVNRLYQCFGEVRPPPPDVPDFLCTFDNDDCGIVNQDNMGSDFERRYANIAGKQGYMMVLDVRRTGSIGARLITPHYSLYGREKGCFSFDYIMEGDDVYLFDVFKQGEKGTDEIYQTKTSEVKWKTFSAEINEEDGDPRFFITAQVRKIGGNGIFAVANVGFRLGQC